jgi:hypothetical protein
MSIGRHITLAKIARSFLIAGITSVAIGSANAASPYDGSWSLAIYTRRGECDPSYNFQVEIRNGVVSHSNIVRLRGRVTGKGAVKVSVAVPGKFAAGSGRLSRNSGGGRWSGHAENARCSGIWTARRY